VSELKYTDIPSTVKSIADGLLPWYGEDCCVRIFNRKWQFREEGAKTIVAQMPEVFTKGTAENGLTAVNTATLQALVEILKDKVQQIITQSFEAVTAYTNIMIGESDITLKSD
jgi:hypothetical protein